MRFIPEVVIVADDTLEALAEELDVCEEGVRTTRRTSSSFDELCKKNGWTDRAVAVGHLLRQYAAVLKEDEVEETAQPSKYDAAVQASKDLHPTRSRRHLSLVPSEQSDK